MGLFFSSTTRRMFSAGARECFENAALYALDGEKGGIREKKINDGGGATSDGHLLEASRRLFAVYSRRWLPSSDGGLGGLWLLGRTTRARPLGRTRC
jgi:hypothetical protein